jgi:hypothetical protein
MVKTTFYLPEKVWREARVLALDRRTSLTALMLEALQLYLKQQKKEAGQR